MKKHGLRCLFLFVFLFFVGIQFSHTTSEAGCYYKRTLYCRKGSSTAAYTEYTTWTYSGDFATAVSQADPNSTIYVQNTSDSQPVVKQIYINKPLTIKGITSLAWAGSGTGYYSYGGSYLFWGYPSGVTNVAVCDKIDYGMPEISLEGTYNNPLGNKFSGSDKNNGAIINDKGSVYGASIVVQDQVNFYGLKISGMCGTYNNPCSLLCIREHSELNNVWLADNNWFTYEGKKACSVTTQTSDQPDGIGNPGGGLTVYKGTCTVGNLKVSNCHGYFQGGGIHVGGEGGYLCNWSSGSSIEVLNCSASSGGGLATVNKGKIELWGTGSVNIHDNYVEDAAYNAYNSCPDVEIGFTAGNVHVASGTYFHFGCARGSFKMYNGGRQSAYEYAHAGTADAGNVAAKGTFVTDHDTYIYSGLGSCASEVIVTGKWFYGHNDTVTTVGQAGNSCCSEVYKAYSEFSGVKKGYGDITECCLIMNQNGRIVGELSGSRLNIETNIGSTNSNLPWHVIWNKNTSTSTSAVLEYHGEITRDPNNISYSGVTRAPNLRALYNQGEAELTGVTIGPNTGYVENNLGEITSYGSCVYTNGIQTDEGAATLLYGDTDFKGSELVNCGFTKIGNYTYNYNPTIYNATIHNDSDSGITYSNEQDQGNKYQTYYNSHPTEGMLVFDYNSTEKCSLEQHEGYVRFANAGGYTDTTEITVDGGSIHLDGNLVDVNTKRIDVNGPYANAHFSNCGAGLNNSCQSVRCLQGRVDLDNTALVSRIYSQDTVDLGGANCRATVIYNCGNGVVTHRYGSVGSVENGISTDATDIHSRKYSKNSEYFQYNGTVKEGDGVKNYGKYHVGDEFCGTSCIAEILTPVTNYGGGIMTIGSEANTNYSYLGKADSSYTRKAFTNFGKVYNNRGKLYLSQLSSVGSETYFFNSDYEITKDYGTDIDVSGTIDINGSYFYSYGGNIRATRFINGARAKTFIRGTHLTCNNVENDEISSLTIKNPLAAGQTTDWTGMITNFGTLNFSSEETDGENLTIDAGKFENQNKLELNIGDSAKHTTLKVTGISPNAPAGDFFYVGSDHTLDIGPAVDLGVKIKNEGSLTFKNGNMWDTSSGFNFSKTTIQKDFYNSKTVTSEYRATVYIEDIVTNKSGATFNMNGQIGSDLDGSIVNSGTMLLRNSMAYSESDCFAGKIINNASLTLGSAGDAGYVASSFNVYNPRPDFDASGKTNYALQTKGGTTTVVRGTFTGSNNYPVYVKDSQFIIDDDSNNVIKGKKITVNLDDTNGTWMNGKVPVIDNSSGTKYQMNFEKEKRATDELAGGLKIPMTTISNANKLSNWNTFVTPSTENAPICENTDRQVRYDLFTHAERDAIPNDNTVYLYLKDVTPPTISTSIQKKYVEVDCRYGSHSTQYVPVTLTDDISGIKSIVIEMTNEDRKKAGLDNYYEKKTINLNNVMEYKITREDLLSFHNDNKPITFGNLKIDITATDAVGNEKSMTAKVMAGRIKVEIYDKFTDSKKQSGNPNTYWNFVSDNGSKDKFVENIGSWLAGDQKWLKVTLEGFWDSASLSLTNTQGKVDLAKNNPNGFTISKNGYKTINGAVNGEETAITVPLKDARFKDLDYVGVLTTKKNGETTDEKTFTFTFSSNRKKTIENSIEKRILIQSTQREDGSYYDGFHVYHD